jgi:hypothetical protein
MSIILSSIPRRYTCTSTHRMINRKHEAIRPHCSNSIHKIRRREMPRGGQPDILLEIIPHRILHGQASVLVVADHPVIDAPQVRGHHLTQVAHDDLHAGETVKDAVDAHAKDVPGDILSELEGCNHEPFAVVPDFLSDMWDLVLVNRVLRK